MREKQIKESNKQIEKLKINHEKQVNMFIHQSRLSLNKSVE